MTDHTDHVDQPTDDRSARRRRLNRDHRVTFFRDFAFKARFPIVGIIMAVTLRVLHINFCWLDSRSGWVQGLEFFTIVLIGATAYNLWGFSRAKDAAYNRYQLHATSLASAVLIAWLIFACDSIVSIKPEMVNVDPRITTACEQNLAPGITREQCYCLYDNRPLFWIGGSCVIDTNQFPTGQ